MSISHPSKNKNSAQFFTHWVFEYEKGINLLEVAMKLWQGHDVMFIVEDHKRYVQVVAYETMKLDGPGHIRLYEYTIEQ